MPREQHSMAVAIGWVSKITTIALEMVIPGLVGTWLDNRWGTQFLALSGFALGITVSIWHLLRLTNSGTKKPPSDADRP